MKAITDVRLSFCCKENWNEFETLDERSRFCATCRHAVVDFTNASDNDFKATMKGGGVCGRFKRSQLSESFLIYIAAASIAGATLTSTPAAQDPQHAATREDIFMGIPPAPMIHVVDDWHTQGPAADMVDVWW